HVGRFDCAARLYGSSHQYAFAARRAVGSARLFRVIFRIYKWLFQNNNCLLRGIADTGLRGKVEDYKAYILSFLFFKRLSDNYSWETERRVAQFREQYNAEPEQFNVTGGPNHNAAGQKILHSPGQICSRSSCAHDWGYPIVRKRRKG